jgi:hypothetical protein
VFPQGGIGLQPFELAEEAQLLIEQLGGHGCGEPTGGHLRQPGHRVMGAGAGGGGQWQTSVLEQGA